MVTRNGFRLEEDMKDRVERWLSRSHTAVRREFETPWGICDLVAASFDTKRKRKRLSDFSEMSLGPLPRLLVLAMAWESGPIRVQDLKRRSREMLGVREFDDHFAQLVSLGLLAIESAYVRRRRVSWLPTHRRLVAVELKLYRVEEAYFQALNNLHFAHASYVALPLPVARRVGDSDWKRRFSKAGVGLVGVASTRCRVLIESRRRPTELDLALQLHSAERLWRWHLRDSASCTAERSAPAASRGR
jgi:hypothetical protein